MGELEGIKGAWGYVEGGMGTVTQAMARSAVSNGATIFVDTVCCITQYLAKHSAVRSLPNMVLCM